MKENYNVIRSKMGFLIESINDDTDCFATIVLASKLLHKMHLEQCIAGAIMLAKLCSEGVQINWCNSC